MTEELELKAEEYCNFYYPNTKSINMVDACIGFATKVTNKLQEELEKWKAEWQEQVQKATDEGYARTQLQIENGKLKEQIEKMKCCENCKHHHFMGDELKCYLDYDTEFECLKTKQNWELAE